MSAATAIALAKVRAHAIREAMWDISADQDNHHGEEFGPDACLGCRWRANLSEFADKVEHEADEL